LSGTTWVSQYQKKHSPTHHPDHHPIFISFFHLPRSIASSVFKLCAWQSFCTTSLHVLFGLPLGLEPPPHIPYISSPNHCLLFATHAHTIATCFAVVPRLYHLFLVFLSTPYLDLYRRPITHKPTTPTFHIRRTILRTPPSPASQQPAARADHAQQAVRTMSSYRGMDASL